MNNTSLLFTYLPRHKPQTTVYFRADFVDLSTIHTIQHSRLERFTFLKPVIKELARVDILVRLAREARDYGKQIETYYFCWYISRNESHWSKRWESFGLACTSALAYLDSAADDDDITTMRN
jgi:hypothetical protein